MEWLKKWTAQIQAQLFDLSVSQKLLIGTLLVVIPMLLWIVMQYAGHSQMVPVLDQTIDQARRAQITLFLENSGIPYQESGDRILVPADRRHAIVARLSLQELLPEDISEGFKAFVENQTWWRNGDQDRQLFDIATQSELARIISAYPWVKKATVIISRPRRLGFAETYVRPTASISIEMHSGRLTQKQVDAVAGLVSGAVAEMKPDDVSVIDAIAGRQWKVHNSDELYPGDYLETIKNQERHYYEKISSFLSFVPKAIVAVNVEVDLMRSRQESKSFDREKSGTLVKQENRRSTENSQAAAGGEPAVRSNAGLDIAGASSAKTVSTEQEEETSFDTFPGLTHVETFKPAGNPTRISATVNVPRSYFVGVYKEGKPADAPEPTDAQLLSVVDTTKALIRKQLEPLVRTQQDPGQVVVEMYPDAAPLMQAAEAGLVSGGGWMSSPWMSQVILGVLALMSLGLMLVMVKRAGQREELPTAEELAGIQAVGVDEGILGEVSSVESALTGVEMDETEIEHQKLIQQVAELAKGNPEDVAGMVKWWIRQHD